MTKKIIKITLILLILIGIGFSVMNFLSVPSTAEKSLDGAKVDGECIAPGTSCVV